MALCAFTACTFAVSLFVPIVSIAQSAAPAPTAHIETAPELFARLSPSQQQQFQEAGRDIGGKQYAEALVVLKALLKELPGDATLSKFAAEAALHIGDDTYARDALQPVAQANPDDWQAVSMLTRAYAELGDKANRDAGIAQMLDLHKRGLTPAAKQDYIVERVTLADGSLTIYTSLEPFSMYKVHNVGEIFDKDGQKLLMATIESSDFDQPAFVKQHPREAAAGLRAFSLDAYRDTGMGANGKPTQTHYTFKFFVGQPDYDTVRQDFLDIATGKIKPISSRDNLPTP